jgi:hypothetical protein
MQVEMLAMPKVRSQGQRSATRLTLQTPELTFGDLHSFCLGSKSTLVELFAVSYLQHLDIIIVINIIVVVIIIVIVIVIIINIIFILNPFTASCENTMTLSVPGVPAL